MPERLAMSRAIMYDRANAEYVMVQGCSGGDMVKDLLAASALDVAEASGERE